MHIWQLLALSFLKNVYICSENQTTMNKKYISFSKLLSRRILIVSLLTITVLALPVILFAISGLIKMNDAYFLSEVKAVHESTALMIDKTKDDNFYNYIKYIEDDINKNPLFMDTWAYCAIIDSAGTYIYHPDKHRIGKGSLFDDIRQSSDNEKKELASGIASHQIGMQQITIDGEPSYIYYSSFRKKWANAIIVHGRGMILPIIITTLILLTMIVLGLLLSYWVSRISIRRATKPLQLLAKSADEVAKGNFENPLPELKQNDEICQLRDSFSNMQQSLITYIEQLKSATAQKAAIESELSIARSIQLSMVPTKFPELEHYDIYGSLTPAKAVGGDIYDFFVRDGKLFFCIGDVCGKGVPAALFMMMAKSLFRAYSKDEDMPDRIVTHMDDDLRKDNTEYMFVTLFVGVLDLSTGLLRYCNAGHQAPILINKTAENLPVYNDPPVGVDVSLSYHLQEVVIEPQTTILLYTDGLNEAMDADFLEFEEARIFDVLNKAIQDGQLAPKDVIDRMTQAVHAFVGDTEQSDDLTMLSLRRN